MQNSQLLTASLFPSASALLAEAFLTNPAHVYICPRPETRFAKLKWLLGGNLRIQSDLSTSFCRVDGEVVNAMGFWTRSSSPKPGLMRQTRAGLPQAPARLGLIGFRRLFQVTKAIDHHLELVMGDQPYWYLNNMVVRRDLRGTGIGTRLLEDQIENVSQLEPSWAMCLSTQREENVTFYQRLGFVPRFTERIGAGPEAFQSWIMVRSGRVGAAREIDDLTLS